MREKYLIEVTRPANCSVGLMKQYLDDAIRGWCGQFEPEHPLFTAFDRPNSPRVTKIRSERRLTLTEFQRQASRGRAP